MKTESRYKNKLTAESCFHLHKILDSVYHWGDAVTKEKLLAQTITLPADKKGEPDWYYMQNYILSIQERTSHSPILI